MMKSRSALEICLPALILAAACALSWPTRALALLWMYVGVTALGHRKLRSFPRDGIDVRWHFGVRSWFLWCFHMAWWPWYMRFEIARILSNLRKRRHVITHEDARGGAEKPGVEPGKDE
jgi:hypothetical protein